MNYEVVNILDMIDSVREIAVSIKYIQLFRFL